MRGESFMNIYKREEGQGLVEYALILVLIAIVVMVILSLLGPQVSGVYARIMAGFNGQALTGQGLEYAFISAGVESSGNGFSCTLKASATVVALEDGRPLANHNVAVTVGTGGATTSLSGTTNRNGLISMGPGHLSGACSGTSVFNANAPATGSVSKRY
jgi:pilus assembly protein Flp/PilA